MVFDRRSSRKEETKSNLENTSSDILMEYESSSIDSSDFLGQKEISRTSDKVGAAHHMKDGIISEGTLLTSDEHDVGLEEHRSPAATLLLLLLILHLIGVLIWLRFWLKDRKMKFPRMKTTPPPQKQSCTYDIDSRYISKIELPLKALKIAKS